MTKQNCIVVTGGAGFIGSSLISQLLKNGEHVVAIDHLKEPYSRILKMGNLTPLFKSQRFEFMEGDFSEFGIWDSISERFNVKTVFHLAAYAGVRPSIVEPASYYHNNVTSMVRLLEVLRHFQISNVVFASSSSVYGHNAQAPFSENARVEKPLSPYAATKLAGEQILFNYAQLHDMNVAAMRLFTVYGPKQRPDLAIRKFVEKIDRGEAITLYGDGTSGRDYTFIDDIVDGFIRSSKWLREQPNGTFDTFNLGSGRIISLNEMVGAIEKVTGRPASKIHEPAHPADMPLTYADISKAQSVLGYEPTMKFVDGVQRFRDWFYDEQLHLDAMASRFKSKKINLFNFSKDRVSPSELIWALSR